MPGAGGNGNLKIGLVMKQFEKMFFESYSDAEIWMANTPTMSDNVIRKEGGKYYIFVAKDDSKK